MTLKCSQRSLFKIKGDCFCSMENIIEVKNVSKKFFLKGISVLKDVNLDIFENEFICFVGPSGCGKSTLVRLIAGLEKPTRGVILYKGKEVKGVNSEISMVFQSFALLPWLTVKENVEFGAKMSGGIDWAEQHWVQGYITMVGLDQVMNMYPRDLSGGMKQRVGIARALVTDPQVLILDEPFSQLDLITASELRKDVLNIWEDLGRTIIMISHLIEEAVELADRVVVFGMGRIEEIVSINLSRPRNKESKEFLEVVDKIERLMGLKND